VAEDFIKVGTRSDLQAAGGKLKVIVNGKGVAIFEIGGALHAVQNACPHRGAPLTTGLLQEMTEGAFVICPDHAWRFRLTDGLCPEAGPECTLMIWDVKLEGENLFLSRLPRLA
jgi:nitrite reductase/ring-hydroxylating ferredoxin subunit